MAIRDSNEALAVVREYLGVLYAHEHHSTAFSAMHQKGIRGPHVGFERIQRDEAWEELERLHPLMEALAVELDPDHDSDAFKQPVPIIRDPSAGTHEPSSPTSPWNRPRTAARRLQGILEQAATRQTIFGPVGPVLAANRLHPWVWNAAADLWDGGHHGPAVHEAAKAVELQTQLKIHRRDLDGKDLYAKAFSTKSTPGETRLRHPHIEKTRQPKDWTSAHEAAQHLGMACAQGIRNPRAHPSDDITEQEALEQLATLSVLARWVDASEVVQT